MSTSVVVLIVVALLLAAGLGTCGYFLYQSKKSKRTMAKTLNKVVGQNNDLVKKESDLTDSVNSLKQQNKNLSKLMTNPGTRSVRQ